MRLTPLVPAGGPAPAGRRWSVAVSVALHAAALLLLVLWYAPRPPAPSGEGPEYQLLFDTAPATSAAPTAVAAPSAPQSAPVPAPDDAPIGPPAPTPTQLPSPDAVTVPPPTAAGPAPEQSAAAPAPRLAFAPQAAPAPPVAPPPEASSQPPSTEPPAPPAPESPAPESPAPESPSQTAPSVRLEVPQGEVPPSLDSTPIMPVPPPPLPRPPPRPAPRPAPRPPPPAASPFGTLTRPMDLSFSGAARPPPPAARMAIGPRALDLRVPTGRGPSTADPYADIRAANASAEWNNGLQRYWRAHRFYPPQAAEQGEQGMVTIELTVARSGRVEEVRVLSSSGSQWLDLAAVSTWRGAKLAPFTDEMHEDRLTFPVPIHYILVGR